MFCGPGNLTLLFIGMEAGQIYPLTKSDNLNHDRWKMLLCKANVHQKYLK